MSDERGRPDNDLPRRERAKPEEIRDWETIQFNEETGDYTERLAIVGGFLYRTIPSVGSVAMCFVPGHNAPDLTTV